MQLQRLDAETDLQYHKRLVYGKLVDRTLADIDYTELAKLVYGQDYSSDVARRMMYGSARTLGILESERERDISDEGLLSDLEAKKLELQKERQKLSDQRRERNKLIAAVGRSENLEDKLLSAASQLNETVGLMRHDTDAYFNCGEDEAVLVLCDWHYGMVTDNVWNTYDVQTCIERVEDVVAKAAQRISLHNCRCLHVVILGDMIHGAIHTSARVASEELVCDQIMQVSEVLAQAISYLANSVRKKWQVAPMVNVAPPTY